MAESYQAPDITLVGADHVKAYRESDGEVGYEWNGVHTLLLTTTGAKSREERTSALIFGRDGEDYLVIASQGGAPTHPNWYHNLLATPRAHLQVKDQHLNVVARTADGEERPRLWAIMAGIWPNYDTYQERTERTIPVVILSPVEDEA